MLGRGAVSTSARSPQHPSSSLLPHCLTIWPYTFDPQPQTLHPIGDVDEILHCKANLEFIFEPPAPLQVGPFTEREIQSSLWHWETPAPPGASSLLPLCEPAAPLHIFSPSVAHPNFDQDQSTRPINHRSIRA